MKLIPILISLPFVLAILGCGGEGKEAAKKTEKESPAGFSGSPTQAFEALQARARAGDFKGVFDLLGTADRRYWAEKKEKLTTASSARQIKKREKLGYATGDLLRKGSVREFFARVHGPNGPGSDYRTFLGRSKLGRMRLGPDGKTALFRFVPGGRQWAGVSYVPGSKKQPRQYSGELQLVQKRWVVLLRRGPFQVCSDNLTQLALGLMMYRQNQGKMKKLPPWKRLLTTLYSVGVSVEPGLFICPETGAKPDPEGLKLHKQAATSYRTTPSPILDYRDADKRPIAWDSAPRHAGYRCVLFLNGRVDLATEQEFATLMDELKERVKRLRDGGATPLHSLRE